MSAPLSDDVWVIEPGAGTGVLIAAVAEHLARQGGCHEWRATAYETETSLHPALVLALGYTRHWLNEQGIHFSFEIKPDDFILANASHLHPAPLLEPLVEQAAPQLVISNPPYFKVPKSDPRVSVLKEVVHGQPNIYALFMAASAKLLRPDGQLIFITPRSFCSGPYFRQFRQWFFQTIALERVHLFESRTEAFERDEVLQENIILTGTKTDVQRDFIGVSASHGADDIGRAAVRRTLLRDLLDLGSPEAVLSIPTGPADTSISEIFNRWPDRLRTLGFEISTGPIVPFRTGA